MRDVFVLMEHDGNTGEYDLIGTWDDPEVAKAWATAHGMRGRTIRMYRCNGASAFWQWEVTK